MDNVQGIKANYKLKISNMSEDEEFELREKNFNEFKAELTELMKKYKVEKKDCDNYDGNEDYCGTDYYFKLDGQVWYVQTIPEILDSIINK